MVAKFPERATVIDVGDMLARGQVKQRQTA